MSVPTQRRKYPRIAVGPDHSIQFRLGGALLDRVPIANLSAGGCFALLPGELAPKLREGCLLMDFVLEHQDLPRTPICSQVTRVVPGLTEVSPDDVGLGIAFLATSPRFYEQVDAYVAAKLPGGLEA